MTFTEHLEVMNKRFNEADLAAREELEDEELQLTLNIIDIKDHIAMGELLELAR